MNRWMRFSGIVGAVLLLFGVLVGFVVGFAGTSPIHVLMFAHLIAGLGLIVLWFLVIGLANMGQANQILRGRSVRFGANVILYSAVFIALLTALNFLVHRHDSRWDLTEQGVYSLAPVSEKTIATLKKPLKLVAFRGGAPEQEAAVADILALVKSANPSRVTTQLVDARAQPQLVELYDMKPGNLLYLEYGEGETKGVSRVNDTTEQTIINSVLKLTRGEAQKVYYVIGHDEPELTAEGPQGLKDFASALADEHLSIVPLLLAEHSAVPADAAAIILSAPKKAMLPQEIDLLVNYGQNGGHLILMTDPRGSEDVRAIALRFGIKINDDVVVDQVQRLFAGPALGVEPVVREYGTHPISAGFTQQSVAVFNQASSVVPAASSGGIVTYTELARTGPQAWAETDLTAIFDSAEPVAERGEGDTAGPVSLAVVYEKKLDQNTADAAPKAGDEPAFTRASRVVVFGDSDWITNANLRLWAHRDLILNTINWAIGDEGGVTIGTRSFREPELRPISSESYMLMLASSFLIPEMIFVLGLIIWWRRRTVAA